MAAAQVTPRTWFRFYSEAVSDRKVARTAKIVGVDKALVVGVWAGLLSLASESPERGALLLAPGLPFTVADMAEEIGCSEETMQAILVQFDTLDMVGWDGDTLIVSHWSERQFESDNSTERVRRFRERKAQRCGNVSVTDHSIAEHSIDIAEHSREESARNVSIETDTPSPEPPAGAPLQATKPKSSPRRGKIAADAPIPQQPEAILVYRELAHLWPNEAQKRAIVAAVTPETVPRWRECIDAWLQRGHNPRNVDGMLDWYRNGIPTYNSNSGNSGRKTKDEQAFELLGVRDGNG